MKFAQKDAFPACDQYIRTYISGYCSVCNQVADAFRTVCENNRLAEQALTFGMNPLIHIGDVRYNINGQFRGRSGGPLHTVFINHRVAEQYEDENRWDIFESTVLHEMVHWARFHAGKPSQYRNEEAGKAFEKLAYGRDIACGCYTMCEII